jgi:hypothetical protein
MTDEPIEGTAEEMPETPAPQATAVAVRERRSEVIRPLNADQLAESFAEYQALLPKLLDESDYQKAENNKKFKKKSAFRKIATAFDLDLVRVDDGVERDEHGQPVRAFAIWRAVAPSGRAVEGDGYCSSDEPRFNRASGRQKLENDLRATATTRAKNRAISDLVGMGEVSAEEVDAGHGSPSAPAWAAPASQELVNTVGAAIGWLIKDPAVAHATVEQLTADTDGVITAAVGRAVVMTISAYKNNLSDENTPTAEPASTEPADAKDAEELHLKLDTEAATS